MSIQTKKRFKNIGKIVGGILFALILFTNIKLALMDDVEIVSGDLSLLGVELTLFEATFANEGGYSCTVTTQCVGGSISCTGTESCSRTTVSVTCDGHTTNC
jgi:hypothetical protein